MKLSDEDADLFFELWMELLGYANKKYQLHPEIKKIKYGSFIDKNIAGEIAKKIFDEIEVIDDYLSFHNNFSQERKEIIEGWKRFVSGEFVLERHLQKGSIFISIDTEKVYQVLGLKSTFKEMFHFATSPIIVEATLLPFKNVIITNGVLYSSNVMLGKNYAQYFKEIYMTAKKEGTIHKKI